MIPGEKAQKALIRRMVLGCIALGMFTVIFTYDGRIVIAVLFSFAFGVATGMTYFIHMLSKQANDLLAMLKPVEVKEDGD